VCLERHNECISFPSRAETKARLVALAEGTLSPGEADDWARPFVVDASTHPDRMDEPVWVAINRLFGADLPSNPGEYLDKPADYASWLTGFRETVTGDR